MPPEDQEKLRSNDEMLVNMIVADPESEHLKAELAKHMDDVLKLARKPVLTLF